MTWGHSTAIAGWSALAMLLIVSIGSVIAVATYQGLDGALPTGAFTALQFTVLQAALSATISTLLAIFLARSLARHRFFGRDLLVTMLGAPFLVPAIVAVFGIVALFGRSGPISDLLQLAGLPALNIYGLPGILLAHVFFNLPLVTRLILLGWADIPAEQFRLAAQLDVRGISAFRLLEWPMLRRILPGAFVLVFLLCSTSFAVVLALGGGPAATTLELAIYQALRFEFDLGGAATLAMIQVAICSLAALLTGVFQGRSGFGSTLNTAPQQWQRSRFWVLEGAFIALTALFLLLPMVVVLARGIPAILGGLPLSIWPALLRSLMVAMASAVLTLVCGLAIAALIVRLGRWSRVVEVTGYLTLAVSPFVIGTGLFILIYPFADPFALALPVTAIVNASLCIPLALRGLVPAFAKAGERNARLADALNLQGWQKFRIAIWPEIRRPAMFATAIAAALSMGDLGVVALFAPPDGGTLPLVMQRLMASYQMDAAAGVATVLMVTAFGLFWLFDRGGRLGH
jgi:thiamine transport system permease protein